MQPRPLLSPVGFEILQLLQVRWDGTELTVRSFLVGLDEILTQLGLPAIQLQGELARLRADGYVNEVRLAQWPNRGGRHRRAMRRTLRLAGNDEPEPAYYITALGHVIVMLIKQWAGALRDAEAIQALLTPGYRRHSHEQLQAIARVAVAAGRDPHEVVTEVLAEGTEGCA